MGYRTFQVSGGVFQGWQSKLDINDYNTIEKVVSQLKMDIIMYLNKGKLIDLIEKVKILNLRSDLDTQGIFHDNKDEIIYLYDKI